jgi:WD40 repeat protein
VGLANHSIAIRDTQTGDSIKVLAGHAGDVTALAWSKDGSLVASASQDKTVGLWRAADGQRLVKWEGHPAAPLMVAVSPDNDVVRACFADGRLASYAQGAKQERSVLKPQAGLAAISLSPSGKRLALVAADGSVQLANCETGESLGTTPPGGAITHVAWCADDVSWISLGVNRQVKYWKLAELDATRGWSDAPAGLARLALSADGSRVLGAAADGLLRLWDARGLVLQAFPWNADVAVQSLALNDNGQVALAAGGDGRAVAFRSSLVRVLKAHAGRAEAVGFAEDKLLISAGADQTIRAWNLVEGTQSRQFEGCPAKVLEMAVAPAASQLVVLNSLS